MAIDFYYGSGSPYAWRVWLALEHKALPYELHVMSFDRGDLRTPAYLKINPRARVPAIVVDGAFALYESAAIVDFLDEAYPRSGAPLFSAEPRARAIERRLIREADSYLQHALEELVEEILFKKPGDWNSARIDAARDAFQGELQRFEGSPLSEAPIGAVDYTIYPMVALGLRMERRKPDLRLREAIGPRLGDWMKKIEALPFFDKTFPPHWRG